MIAINIYERKVLNLLIEDGLYYGFAWIVQETKLDRPTVRRACRSLARKGLTEYGRGLWNDAGEPCGSGYRATKLARISPRSPQVRAARLRKKNNDRANTYAGSVEMGACRRTWIRCGAHVEWS
jgi:hypothetical protein